MLASADFGAYSLGHIMGERRLRKQEKAKLNALCCTHLHSSAQFDQVRSHVDIHKQNFLGYSGKCPLPHKD